ncbi:hypothetical protein [Terrabacter sp. NPDC000476]|uniref:hypothetical protein n=1 Tax=Terrabacter sp. NPDC000476 TaxID=3154258 RepID=UPI00332981E2
MGTASGPRPLVLRLPGGAEARAVCVDSGAELTTALEALGLRSPVPVVVVVGGASGLGPRASGDLLAVVRDGLLAACETTGAVVLDGGTDAGVMALLGQARDVGSPVTLVGVAARGTVDLPGEDGREGTARLEPRHDAFVLVPGDEWGAESPWIAAVAMVLAGDAPSVTVVLNGGDIAYADLRHSVSQRRPVVALAGSGRTADELVAAVRGQGRDTRAVQLARSGMVEAVEVAQPDAVRRRIVQLLTGRSSGPASGGDDRRHDQTPLG